MAAILDPEALRHRDLDRGDVVAVPDRLEVRVREAEVQELVETHLPEEVVDPVQLRLVDVLVDLRRELARRLEIVAERLLDHDARRLLGQPRVGQALDHPAEQERRDLEIEHRALRVADRAGDSLVRRGVAEVAAHVRHPADEPVEHALVNLLAGSPRSPRGHGCAGRRASSRDGDADDRAAQQAPLLEAVERMERHHLGEVARDPEDHEHVCDGLTASRAPGSCRARARSDCCGHSASFCGVNRLGQCSSPGIGPASPHLGESPRGACKQAGYRPNIPKDYCLQRVAMQPSVHINRPRTGGRPGDQAES